MFAADMTEAKLREEHIRFLMREQSHRLKNLLALVLSIARQSAETGRDRFIESFEARICALAATQDFLLAQDRSRISLEELLRAQLAHFDNGASKRVLLSGPPLFIEQAAAQILALTFHELATNAGKYGALSKGDGEVSISWNIDKSDGAGDVFLISWQERNGPPVLPPLKTGFGLTVIKDMIAESLGGKTGLDFQPQGLTWRLTCPANELISADASHRQETSDLREANPRKAG
jgi:two-component sensor histidine kinase